MSSAPDYAVASLFPDIGGYWFASYRADPRAAALYRRHDPGDLAATGALELAAIHAAVCRCRQQNVWCGTCGDLNDRAERAARRQSKTTAGGVSEATGVDTATACPPTVVQPGIQTQSERHRAGARVPTTT